jgi:hypothetical protein
VDHGSKPPSLHDHVNPLDPNLIPFFPNLLRVTLEHQREIDDVDVFRTASV